ncbi:hypothetical protein ACS7SF_09030 [Ralstonia sp. 25C]|uniref:hypothetical protein n=1 Tax=Ralstonia sp. 25C TaxID=3447363 RepID=UPI003F750ABA
MKNVRLLGIKNPAIIFASSFLLFSGAPDIALGSQTTLPGGQSIELNDPLNGDIKSRFGNGWSSAFFVARDGHRLRLFSDEKLTKNGGIVFEDFDQRGVSASGRYVVLPLVRQGTLEIAGKKPHIEGREYCPTIETTTGCILSMPTGEICGGEWSPKGDKWLVGNVDRTNEMTEKTTPSADELWRNFSNSTVRLNLRDVIISNMGVSNLVACDPPKDTNRHSYLAIARQLEDEKMVSEAAYIKSKFSVHAEEPGVIDTRLRVNKNRAWLYDSPNPKTKTKMYLIKGDFVTVVNRSQTGWLEVDYLKSNGQVVRKWINEKSVGSPDETNSSP